MVRLIIDISVSASHLKELKSVVKLKQQGKTQSNILNREQIDFIA